MTEQEQKLNWYAIMESGSMTAIHNIREYIKQLEKENACCLEDSDTCLAKDKWEIAQREIAELKAQIEKIQNGTLLKELTEKCKDQAETITKYKKFVEDCMNEISHSYSELKELLEL